MDDESSITHTLKMFLEDAGYTVHEQNDPVYMVEVAHQFAPHLILLDYRMPWLNGDELVMKLQQDETLRDIPVMFMSVSPKEEILQHLQRKNYPILHKPLQLDAIKVFLDRQKICPKCGAVVKLRAGQNEAGSHIRIWSCSKHPACDGWMPFE